MSKKGRMRKLVLASFLLLAAAVARSGETGTRKTWAAKPADPGSRCAPHRVRIVDYGDDLAWNYNVHVYRGGFQNQESIEGVDIDDDREKDDCIAYWEFSLDKPLNPVAPHWNTDATNWRFYGGFKGFFANAARSVFSEMCTNVDHPGDNINMMVQNWREPYRVYGIWLWKKEDFLNGGDKHKVSFGDGDKIGLHVARYCTGCKGRFVIKDGDQFYISNPSFQGAGESFAETGKGDNHSGYTHVCFPAATRWAAYNPKPPHDIVFEPGQAEFKQRSFDDVQSVGYYFAKHELAPSATWLKLYAFEVYGTVHKPVRPSATLSMTALNGRTTSDGLPVPDFYVSTTEIPYALWNRVWRWAASPMFAFDWNYVFDRTGDMGSMDFALGEHKPDEPATDMTWLDAVTWCNALSELEGKEPCYYADPEFRTVLKKARERWYDRETNAKYVPKVHAKWEADGYRLPVPAEWQAAAGGSPVNGKGLSENRLRIATTHAVGSAPPNENGLYDIIGNVWEWIWDCGQVCDPSARDCKPRHAVFGGSFHGPKQDQQQSASPYGDEPWLGSHCIGFRVVRRRAGLGPPPIQAISVTESNVPAWVVQKGERIAADNRPAATDLASEMAEASEGSFVRFDGMEIQISAFEAGQTEVTFAEWKAVRDWARANGYDFNYDGDMGSMNWQAGQHRHGPDEPVTRVSFYDAVAWCNALSERDGRVPCYYVDRDLKNVYRRSLPYREAMTFRGPWGDGIKPHDRQEVHVNWAANGYRLPTKAEWEYAARGGSRAQFYWGDQFDERYAWCQSNSGGKTHAVGKTPANALGLHDVAGNVFEWCWGEGRTVGDPYDVRNPKGIHGRFGSMVVRGGSFRYPGSGNAYARFFSPAYDRPNCRLAFAYPEIGFRVVRCRANTHPVDGVEKVDVVHLDVDPATPVDPLQGATFRGNLQRTGVYQTQGVPELTGLKWKFETGGAVKTSPIVADGVVYVGSTDGHFYTLDARTGEPKWKYGTGQPILSSPTLAKGVVYFGCEDGNLHALDAATGDEKWQVTVKGARSVNDSPVVGYGAVFAYFQGWGYETGLYAIDAGSGEIRARYRLASSPGRRTGYALSHGRLISGGKGSQGSTGGAVSVRTGRSITLRVNRVWGNTPVVGDTVYGAGMCVSAVDLPTGKNKYVRWIEGEGYEDSTSETNESRSGPAIWEGTMLFGSETGYFYAYDASQGTRKWKVKVGDRVRSAPSVAEGTVYFGCDDGHLYALDVATGKELWKFKTDGPIESSPCLADGVVYVGSDDGCLYAIH